MSGQFHVPADSFLTVKYNCSYNNNLLKIESQLEDQKQKNTRIKTVSPVDNHYTITIIHCGIHFNTY